jgi:hypothetical protein
MQEILMYSAVIAAIGYLGWKFFWPKKPRKPECGSDCGCN